MLDLLCLGTVSIDLYYKGDSLTESGERFELAIGGKYYVNYFYEGLGGGGANVAIGAKKNDISVGLVAKIGNNPFKDLIQKKLNESQIEHKNFCDLEETYMNISSILLNSRGEKTIINYRTPHENIFQKDDDFEKIDSANTIYMANLSTVSLSERIKILTYAKSRQKKVIINLNVTDCRRDIKELSDLFDVIDIMILNGHEYADIIKTPYETIDFHTNIIEKYLPFHKNCLLVITDGKKGSYAYLDSKIYFQEAIPVSKVIDSTGAGDGYTAGFIAEYIRSQNIDKAMKNGAAYAVKILEKLGAN